MKTRVNNQRLLCGTLNVSRQVAVFLVTASCLVLTVSCRQDMQDQPKMKPLRSSTFFRDGLSARQPVEGTVPRGFLKNDAEFFTGKRSMRGTTAGGQISPVKAAPAPATPQPQPSPGTSAATGAQTAAAYPDDIAEFPIPINEQTVYRGKERYDIFCSVCHGLTGNGDGMVVRRGFRRAASFHDERLRQAPVGHFFDAISNGWGAMPSYASQIPPQDRWAIIAYVRALQVTQQSVAPTATPSPASSSPPRSGQSGGLQY